MVTAQQFLVNKPGLKTLPAAMHYGRGAIDQYKCWEIEMCFRVDPEFKVPFAAWNAAIRVTKEVIISSGRCAWDAVEPFVRVL